MSEAPLSMSGTTFYYILVNFLVGYTIQNKEHDKINQVLLFQ